MSADRASPRKLTYDSSFSLLRGISFQISSLAIVSGRLITMAKDDIWNEMRRKRLIC